MTQADKINKAIADGMTVYVSTYGRIVKINKRFKGAKHWIDLGFEFFRMCDNGDLLMIDGYKDGKRLNGPTHQGRELLRNNHFADVGNMVLTS